MGTCTEDQKQQWANENDVSFVNRIIEDQLPQAITLEMLTTATAKDPVPQQFKDDNTETKFCRNSLTKYKQIFDDYSYINGVIMTGTQTITPESLQAEVISLTHEGYSGAMKTLSPFRQTCWFPKMSKLVNEYVQTYLPL